MLTWKIQDRLDVQILVPSSASLSAANKQSLSFLAKAGVRIGRQEGPDMVSDVSAIVQVGRGETEETLFTLEQESAVPSERWLKTNDTSIWVSSQNVSAFHAVPLDTTGWDLRDSGATVVEVSMELNGPMSSLRSRLCELFREEVPAFAELLEKDRAIEVEYSDRNLKSPWSVLVMSGFLSLFSNDWLRSLKIVTLEPQVTNQPSDTMKHDWPRRHDMEKLITGWLEATVSVTPQVMMCEKAQDIQHSRVLSVSWASGKKTKLILDQGAGYWQPRTPYRDQVHFNFDEHVKGHCHVAAAITHDAAMKKTMPLYHGHCYPAVVINCAARWDFRFQLSLRDIEELLFERGVVVSYETVRRWCNKFGAGFASHVKAARCKPGTTWHLDEMFVTLRGEPYLLWRAVDHHGAELDVVLQKRRDKAAAKRFFGRVLASCGEAPRKIVTDQLRSYPAAKAEIPELAYVKHVFVKAAARLNNHAENSHQPTRRCERQMCGFRDPHRTQAFLSCVGPTAFRAAQTSNESGVSSDYAQGTHNCMV